MALQGPIPSKSTFNVPSKQRQKFNKTGVSFPPCQCQVRARGDCLRQINDVSPLLDSEHIAARLGLGLGLGLEFTVSELERLFHAAAAPPPLVGVGPRRPVRVAYQGVPGSYCQEAALEAFSSGCEAFPCEQMEKAFSSLEDGSADRAVVPVENSLDGPIDRNLDLLLRHPDIRIVGEFVLPVNHCLLSVPGSSLSDLRRIVSHPQALSHCAANLRSASACDLEIREVPSAAEAARYVAENGIADTAVIGSRIAAAEFGLRVLEQNFQDLNGNFNRFLQLGLSSDPPESAAGGRTRRRSGWKTTVAFSLERGVSDLYRVLWQFESRNLKVTRVEHRPNRSSPIRVQGELGYMDYVFILDLEGPKSDPIMKTALAHLKQISGSARVLGSYTCGLVL